SRSRPTIRCARKLIHPTRSNSPWAFCASRRHPRIPATRPPPPNRHRAPPPMRPRRPTSRRTLSRNLSSMPFPMRTIHHGRMEMSVLPNASAACQLAAEQLITWINLASQKRGKVVLGLATGSTPKEVYAFLIAQHHQRNLSFRNVITYNLDEYYPISPLDPQS